jgi:hypothetical protein
LRAMGIPWDRGHKLALAGVLAAVFFGVPAWLAYFKDDGTAATTPPSATTPRTTSRTTPTPPPKEPPTPSASSLTQSATHTFPGPYIGTIWIRIRRPDDVGSVAVSLGWGAKHRSETVDLSDGPVYLTSTKNGPDGTPINVTVDRPVTIRFGTGEPPSSATTTSIDRGWTS